MNFFTKLDRYIIKSFLAHFVLSLGFIMLIIIVFDISEKIDDFLRTQPSLWTIISDYYVSFVPYIGMMLAPLFIFISVILFTSRTAMRSEYIAVLSSGVSFYRILVPYLITSIFLAGLSWYGYHYLLPKANKVRLDFENKYVRRTFRNTDRDIHIKDSENTFVYFQSYNAQDSVGHKFAMEQFNDNGELQRKITSPRVTWNSKTGTWRIANYSYRKINGLEEKLGKGTILDTLLNITPEDFGRKADLLENLTTPELKELIVVEQMKGSDMISSYRVKLYERDALVFSIFILVIIGFSFSSRKVRGGIGLHLITGLIMGFSFIFLSKITTVYAQNMGLAPLAAVWIPNIFFSMVATYLLLKAPK